MAITRIGGANAISGTIPQGNIANASLGAVTALPAAISTGKVLQVVQGSTTTQTNSSSTTLADTGLTATITPASTSSKILVIVHQNGIEKTSDSAGNDMKLILLRGSTNISNIVIFSLYENEAKPNNGQTLSHAYLDSPNTTSATTYKTQFSRPDGSGTVRCQSSSTMSSITLMEMSAW